MWEAEACPPLALWEQAGTSPVAASEHFEGDREVFEGKGKVGQEGTAPHQTSTYLRG